MGDLKLGVIETQFAEIVWRNQPLTTKKLVEICADELQWKRTTTYTVLKKLCDRGIFRNQDGTVTALISKSEYCAMQSAKFVEETFDGSLPAFLAAFTKRKNLTASEIAQIRAMIDGFEEG